MDPLSVISEVVTTIILPNFLKKVSEKTGEEISENAIKKSGKTMQQVKRAVQNKLEQAGTLGLLKRAEKKPTEQNLQILQGELVNQMEEDREFANQIQQLIDQIQTHSPSLQIVLDTVRIKGSAEIGNVAQVSEDSSTEQIFGRNLGVGGDFMLGDITQKIQKNQLNE
ncbi:hypothetical protein POG22_17590 [Geitlerinema sp. CS-897]|nr:hypothetical protein [Geitlerinema sp. CS-897]